MLKRKAEKIQNKAGQKVAVFYHKIRNIGKSITLIFVLANKIIGKITRLQKFIVIFSLS